MEVIYFDQLREQLDLDKSVQENVGEGNDTLIINGQSRHYHRLSAGFPLFAGTGPDPGQHPFRRRAQPPAAGQTLYQTSNVLVMDEPTNDLDAETLELLEDLLLEYSGTLLLVSHDREFLNNVVTSTLVFEGDGRVANMWAGMTTLARGRRRRFQPAAPKPKAPRR